MSNRVLEAFKSTNGIVEQEFSREVIEASQPRVTAMINRISTGQSTFEQEDALLLEEWRKIQKEMA